MIPNNSLSRRRALRHARAFSLVEVVISMGICVCALFPIMTLLISGLRVDLDSRQQVQAADLATLLSSVRRNAPTTDLGANFVLPKLNQPYPDTAVTNWVTFAGAPTKTPSAAAFRVSYQVGTNTINSSVGIVHLIFTWPPGADPTRAPGRYETTTQVLMPQ